ncbi:MAG: hypothetical protein U0529_02740 [Thermoanaerobaculia bacterium]
MVPITSLWIPILVSAALVFVVSSVIHMLLPIHKGDFRKLPKEDEALEAMGRLGLPPGDYMFPQASAMSDLKDPAFLAKMAKGPVGTMTIVPSGPPAMGASLGLWFVYCAVVGLFAAYVAGRALAVGAHYLAVFRFAGVTAFVGYSLALWQNTIWYRRSALTTLKSTVDGLVYALCTAGVFGWLWPR